MKLRKAIKKYGWSMLSWYLKGYKICRCGDLEKRNKFKMHEGEELCSICYWIYAENCE